MVRNAGDDGNPKSKLAGSIHNKRQREHYQKRKKARKVQKGKKAKAAKASSAVAAPPKGQ